MTTETSTRAVNDVVMATGGHDTTSLLSADEFKDVTHRAELQTPTDSALRHKTHTYQIHCDVCHISFVCFLDVFRIGLP